jgi:multiple sugar transport system substrate-binding protein
MKRSLRILLILLLVVPAVGLVAFGPRPESDLPKNRTIVEYWEKWSGPEEAAVRPLIDEFNDTVGREKNIYVRYLSTSAIDRKTLVAIAAGTPPDIAGMWDHTLVQYAAMDALEPLDDLAREAGIDEQTYKPVYWRACHYDGQLYALISTPGVVALLYNRLAFERSADALRAQGLDPNRPPQTIDELIRYSDALTQVGRDGHVSRVGFLPLEPGWYLPFMPFWFGGSIFDEQTKQLTLTDPGVVAAYDFIARFSRKMGAQEMVSFRSASGSGSNWQSPQNPFITGGVLMEQNGPWMALQFDQSCPEKEQLLWPTSVARTKSLAERKRNVFWAAAAFPSAVPGLNDVSYCTSDVLVIPRGAAHKREAFTFMAWLNRQDVMERLCSAHCKNSPLAKVSESFIDNHPNPYIDVYERLAASPNAHGVPQIPILQEVRDELDAVAQRVTLLQTDPATALRDAQQRLDVKYADFLQMQEKRKEKQSH